MPTGLTNTLYTDILEKQHGMIARFSGNGNPERLSVRATAFPAGQTSFRLLQPFKLDNTLTTATPYTRVAIIEDSTTAFDGIIIRESNVINGDRTQENHLDVVLHKVAYFYAVSSAALVAGDEVTFDFTTEANRILIKPAAVGDAILGIAQTPTDANNFAVIELNIRGVSANIKA